MNIFVLDESPEMAARYHCDKHVVKMLLETAQMLCTVHRLSSGVKETVLVLKNDGYKSKEWWSVPSDSLTPDIKYRRVLSDYTLYAPTHINHPCTVWAGASLSNYTWLLDLATCLNNEWQERYGHPSTKLHKSYEVILKLPKPSLPDIGLTPFAQAMPEEYRDADAVKAYRDYYIGEKLDICTWRNGAPKWVK